MGNQGQSMIPSTTGVIHHLLVPMARRAVNYPETCSFQSAGLAHHRRFFDPQWRPDRIHDAGGEMEPAALAPGRFPDQAGAQQLGGGQVGEARADAVHAAANGFRMVSRPIRWPSCMSSL